MAITSAKPSPVKSTSGLVTTTAARDIAREVAQEEVGKVTQDIRADFLVIFGIFASILIFLGVEIQVFKFAVHFSLLVGFSLFLLGALLSFLLGIVAITKDRMNIDDYSENLLVRYILGCFIASGGCFFWATILKPILKI